MTSARLSTMPTSSCCIEPAALTRWIKLANQHAARMDDSLSLVVMNDDGPLHPNATRPHSWTRAEQKAFRRAVAFAVDHWSPIDCVCLVRTKSCSAPVECNGLLSCFQSECVRCCRSLPASSDAQASLTRSPLHAAWLTSRRTTGQHKSRQRCAVKDCGPH